MHGFSTAAFEPEENRFSTRKMPCQVSITPTFQSKALYAQQISPHRFQGPGLCIAWGNAGTSSPSREIANIFQGRALARECQKGCEGAPLCWPPWFSWLVRPPHCFHRSIRSFSTGRQVSAYNTHTHGFSCVAPPICPLLCLLCLSPAPRVLALENSASIGRWCRAPCSGQ